MQPFGRNGYGWGRVAGSPSNTMWPWPRPTCVLSFILIRQTVWSQYTNVTDRTVRADRQRSDSIGRTVLQTVAQKLASMLVQHCHRSDSVFHQRLCIRYRTLRRYINTVLLLLLLNKREKGRSRERSWTVIVHCMCIHNTQYLLAY